MTIVVEVNNELHKEQLKVLKETPFIQPSAASSQTENLSHNPFSNKSLNAGWNLNGNILANILQSERLALVLI